MLALLPAIVLANSLIGIAQSDSLKPAYDFLCRGKRESSLPKAPRRQRFQGMQRFMS